MEHKRMASELSEAHARAHSAERKIVRVMEKLSERDPWVSSEEVCAAQNDLSAAVEILAGLLRTWPPGTRPGGLSVRPELRRRR